MGKAVICKSSVICMASHVVMAVLPGLLKHMAPHVTVSAFHQQESNVLKFNCSKACTILSHKLDRVLRIKHSFSVCDGLC